MRTLGAIATAMLAGAGCGGGAGAVDAAADATPDAPVDAPLDAPVDAAIDATPWPMLLFDVLYDSRGFVSMTASDPRRPRHAR